MDRLKKTRSKTNMSSAKGSKTSTDKISARSSVSSAHEHEIREYYLSEEKYERYERELRTRKMKKNGIDIYPFSFKHPFALYLVYINVFLYFFSFGWFSINFTLKDLVIDKSGSYINRWEDALTDYKLFKWVAISAVISVKLISVYLCRFLGNKYVIYLSSIICIIAAFIGSYEHLQVYIMMGMIGFSLAETCVVVYLVECSPPGVRSTAIAFVFFGYRLGRYASLQMWDTFKHKETLNLWPIIPSQIALFSVLQIVTLFYLPKSPAYLISVGEMKEAEESLMILRRVPFVYDRIALIQGQMFSNRTKVKTRQNSTSVISTLILICLFHYMGYTSNRVMLEDKLNSDLFEELAFSELWSCLINLLSILIIEKLGTKKCLVCNFLCFLLAHMVIYIYLTLNSMTSHAASKYFNPKDNSDECSWNTTTCVECLKNERCSFCYKHVEGEILGGFCSLADMNLERTASEVCGEDKSYSIAIHTCPPRTELNFNIFSGKVFFLLSEMFGARAIILSYLTIITTQRQRQLFTAIAFSAHEFLNFVIDYDDLVRINDTLDHVKYSLYIGLAMISVIYVVLFVVETKAYPLEYCDLLHLQGWCQKAEVHSRDFDITNLINKKQEQE